MARYLRIPCVALLALGAATASTLASAQARDPGWDIGGDLVWQDKKTINFNGGTQVRLDDDWGLSFTFGYRFNSKVEVGLAILSRYRSGPLSIQILDMPLASPNL